MLQSEECRDGIGPQSTHTVQGCGYKTAPLQHNHPYISSCKLQIAEISTAATYVVMVMWEWCTVTLYVYFVDHCYPYIRMISA